MSSGADLSLMLVVQPAVVRRRRLADLVLELVIDNRGPEPVEDAVGSAQLLVDGQYSVHFGLTAGNGPRSPGQYRVLPDERRSFRLPGLGPGLFDGLGDHELVLRIGAATSAPARVTVSR